MLRRSIIAIVRAIMNLLKRDEFFWSQNAEKYPPKFSYHWTNKTLFPKILRKTKKEFRANYTWGVLHAANLAKAIGYDRISIIEFGVAGGNGLISLEKIAGYIENIIDVSIDVYGFDTGKGLPEPQDYRDLPNKYINGMFAMDIEKLKKRLKKAKLIIGKVEDTIETFIKSEPFPVGFISFDMDFYSSTMHALKLFDANFEILLPRIYCYFDDIMGIGCGDFNGERLAITDFNLSHDRRKISPVYGLKHFLPKPYSDQIWTEMFFLAYIFDHNKFRQLDNLSAHSDLSLIE